MKTGKWKKSVVTAISAAALCSVVTLWSIPAAAKYKAPIDIISIGSHASGSVYVVYLANWAKILESNFENLSANVEAGGSTKNIILVHTGKTEFGMTTGTQGYMGMHGLGWADGNKYDKIKALFPAYPAITAIWTLEDSPVKNFPEDAEGRNVCLGARGSLTDIMVRQMFDLFNIKPNRIVNSSWADTTGLMADRMVDVTINIGGHPAGFLRELEARHNVRFLELSDDVKKKFTDVYPYYGLGDLPAVYKGMDGKDIKNTLLSMNFVFTNEEMPEEFVYNIVKTTWENVEKIHAARPSLFFHTDFNNLKNVPIEFHPGAIRYYKEKGIALPEPVPAPK